VVQAPTCPRQQPKPLSQTVSQSWSVPSQVSAGGAQPGPFGGSQEIVQVPEPVEPHDVVQETGSPMAQAKPSSIAPSQSSSAPLHDSVEDPKSQAYSQPGRPSTSAQPGRQRVTQTPPSQAPSAFTAPAQACPHEPQWSALVWVSTHDPLHATSGGVQEPTQTPDEQSWPDEQAKPQPPQCCGLLNGSMHAPSHRTCPGGHPGVSAPSLPPPSSRVASGGM
jgi:hypothetical protein